MTAHKVNGIIPTDSRSIICYQPHPAGVVGYILRQVNPINYENNFANPILGIRLFVDYVPSGPQPLPSIKRITSTPHNHLGHSYLHMVSNVQ